MEDKIYEMLYEIRPENNFRNSCNFIQDVLLDSLNILDLVSMIEDEYQINISPKDIVPENFFCIESIKNMIEKSSYTAKKK